MHCLNTRYMGGVLGLSGLNRNAFLPKEGSVGLLKSPFSGIELLKAQESSLSKQV